MRYLKYVFVAAEIAAVVGAFYAVFCGFTFRHLNPVQLDVRAVGLLLFALYFRALRSDLAG